MQLTVQPPLRLTICITTFNRGKFIGATLESILPQLTSECEVLVLDGGSNDATESVVAGHAARCAQLRYVRQPTNSGFDRDLNSAVELAHGQYCWLMSDDDLLKPSAVATVLDVLNRHREASLIVLNVEFKDFTMSRVVQRRWLDYAEDRQYRATEMDLLFGDLGYRFLYLGGVIIKRNIWLERDRDSYYGSSFVYAAVIFQRQLPAVALFIAEPQISFRTNNAHTWSRHVIEIIWIRWPALVWSFALSEAAKRKVCSLEPWKDLQELLVWRALGHYSLKEYRHSVRPRLRSPWRTLAPILVAVIPGVLVNAWLVFYFSVTRRSFHGWRRPELMLQDLRNSRFHFANRRLARAR
jgi:abequosyltransferase